MTIEAILQWFALFGGITGLATFILKVRADIANGRDAREARRVEEVETWREVAAYRFFCDVGQPKSRDDLLAALRNYSFEDKKIDIRKDELSGEAVERLIISLVSKSLIDPFDGDNFIVRVMSFEKLEQRAFIPPFPTQYGIVLQNIQQNPGEYTEITLRQVCDFESRPVHFRELLQHLLATGLIAFGPDGKLYPIHEDQWATSVYSSSLGDATESAKSIESTSPSVGNQEENSNRRLGVTE